MVNSKISGGCWTCRGTPLGALLSIALELTSPERKIRCDRQIPFCQNCFRSKRQCQGYGIRLSWPRPGDQRRAVCAKNPLTLGNTVGLLSGNKVQFLNVFASDLRLYNDICGDDTLCKIANKFCSTYLKFTHDCQIAVASLRNPYFSLEYPRIQKGPSWIPSSLEERRATLISYCTSYAKPGCIYRAADELQMRW